VGKTTLVKKLIRGLILDERRDARRVFYYSCDIVDSPRELIEIVTKYIIGARQDTKKRLYIFLDEISSVRDWQRGVKYLADSGRLRGVTLILTGSHSIDIKRGQERLPGRRGSVNEVLDKILVPMKFSEYVETIDESLREKIRTLGLLPLNGRKACIRHLVEGKIPSELHELSYLQEIKQPLLV